MGNETPKERGKEGAKPYLFSIVVSILTRKLQYLKIMHQ